MPTPLPDRYPAGVANDARLEVRDEIEAMNTLLSTYHVQNSRTLAVAYLRGFTQRRLLHLFARWLVVYGQLIDEWDVIVKTGLLGTNRVTVRQAFEWL